ncbi:cytochrome c [Devosia sp.]|uniref:c-type cytochrome n=1 Tax=Devosia sp. TaxID=1871048 RepID=UPI003264961B
MTLRTIAAFAVAGLMLASVGASVLAAEFVAPATPEAAVAARQALMKSNGGVLRSAGNLTGAEAEAAMQTLVDNFTHLPLLFPKDSIVGESEALPVIWEKFDDFAAIAMTGKTTAEAGLAAAKAGDNAAYADAIKAIGGTCGQCHQSFRGH